MHKECSGSSKGRNSVRTIKIDIERKKERKSKERKKERKKERMRTM